MKTYVKELGVWKKVILVMIAALTLLRIWLGVKTPLYLQAGASCDDFLLVRYAVSMLEGNWLGEFGELTLVKCSSFSAIMAADYLLGIPYAAGLSISYMIAVLLISAAFYQLVLNKKLAAFLYILLLYSPVMFHEENTQKIYRGGVHRSIFFVSDCFRNWNVCFCK